MRFTLCQMLLVACLQLPSPGTSLQQTDAVPGCCCFAERAAARRNGVFATHQGPLVWQRGVGSGNAADLEGCWSAAARHKQSGKSEGLLCVLLRMAVNNMFEGLNEAVVPGNVRMSPA